jgi:hypothetical protein
MWTEWFPAEYLTSATTAYGIGWCRWYIKYGRVVATEWR